MMMGDLTIHGITNEVTPQIEELSEVGGALVGGQFNIIVGLDSVK